MQKSLYFFIILGTTILLTSCRTSSSMVWEDTKTMGRYLQRQGKILCRKEVDSKLLFNEDDFLGPEEEEFIPLDLENSQKQVVEKNTPQPKQIPGALGSEIPSIDRFVAPKKMALPVFETIHFHTDQHTPKSEQDLEIIDKIAKHMQKNPTLYITIEGHCDERASEAYNLALGTRRANHIRRLLIKRGIDPDRIFPVSYGKERPVDFRHNVEGWAKNRRAEFKIYDKKDKGAKK